MQVERKKGSLLGRWKLVAVSVLVAVGTIVGFVQMTAQRATVEEFTGAGDAFILVHLSEAKTFVEANAFCAEEYNTNLAVIEDSDANQRFWDALAHYSLPAWIGFADMANAADFEWVDASPDAYTNWDAGEPTDLCVQMLAATGTWKDVECTESKTAFFCEAPADLSATAVVRLDNAEVHSLPTAVTSAEALAHCLTFEGAELYSVLDQADNGRMQTALNALALDSAWFGLETAAASYQWLDGRTLDFAKWAVGHPLENQFSQMRASDGRWQTACADDSVLGVICTAMQRTPAMSTVPPVSGPPVVFEEDNVSWEKLAACNEVVNKEADYFVDNRQSLNLTKVVSVLFVPTFVDADFDAYAVQTMRCNYAVRNMNKGLEMSYQLNDDGSFQAQADNSQWHGSASAINRLWNVCIGDDESGGVNQVYSIYEKIYQACGNSKGFHFETLLSAAVDWCHFDFGDSNTWAAEIYVAFDNSGAKC